MKSQNNNNNMPEYNYQSKYGDAPVSPNSSRERDTNQAMLDQGLQGAQMGASTGATAGATVGAIAGSVIPGAGTAVGGAIGGAFGAVQGALIGGTVGAFQGKESAERARNEYDIYQRRLDAYERSIIKDVSRESLAGYPTQGIVNSDL
jgi:hypothetical protein